MATREFRETVQERVRNDETFGAALLDEAMLLFSTGEPDMAKLIMSDIPSQQSRLYRVVSFQIVDKYTIQVEFDDGLTKTINLEPMLHGPIFRPLRDPALFAQVSLNMDFGALEWPNGADVAPNVLHDWSIYVPEIIKQRQELALREKG
jgi:hypothetical protein